MNKLKEIWRDIKGYEGLYQVSNLGGIRSVKKGNVTMKPFRLGLGYRGVGLHKNHISTRIYVHRLVADAFLRKNKNKKDVNHINGIKSDNRLVNLERCTRSQNCLHAFKINIKKPLKGIMNPLSKLTNKNVEMIRKNYIPYKVTSSDLAKKYGVSQSVIINIILGKAWKHI